MTQNKTTPKEILETNDSTHWKPCIICGGELIQIRKAFFSCLKCNQEYIADEEDMKGETPFKIYKQQGVKDDTN